MKRRGFAFALLAAFSIGSSAAGASSTGVLAARIDPFLARHPLSDGKIGVIFCDGKSGQVLYARNENLPLKPASNNKILTTAAALHFLGPDFRYRTLVALRGRPGGSAWEGDLVVVGSGDPSISGRFAPNHDRKAIFRQWAKALRDRGIQRIAGDIVGIDDAFDDESCASEWPTEDRGEWYCAEVSALAFNEGCIDVRWQGTTGGDSEPARFDLIPPTRYVHLINFVTTVRDSAEHERYYERAAGRNVITARGRVGKNQEVYDSATVFNPTLYFVTVLRETLLEENIDVGGQAVDIDDVADKSVFQHALEPLTVYESPPLSELIEVVNRNSHNFFAEQILKTLGRQVTGEGSFAGGTAAVRRYVEELGIDGPEMALKDGSGLSRGNRVTAAQLAAVLRAVDRGEHGALFRQTLPVGGQSGSLRKRFRANGRLREVGPSVQAKTGYIRDCHALSGWLETRAGQSICFSILCNDLSMTYTQTKIFIEQLVALVAELDKAV